MRDPADVAAASLTALPFAVVLAALQALAPARAAQRAAADPLVQLLEGAGGPWVVVAATVAVAAAWVWIARPRPAHVARAARWGVAGVVSAIALALVLRVLAGDRLPSFVPPEESARPGLTLGLAAGLVEEVVFRLVMLPALFFALRRRGAKAAAPLAVVLTGAAFALSHELRPAGGVFDPRFLATRFVVPGVAMSVPFFRPAPALIVCGHCAAHLVIPFLFR